MIERADWQLNVLTDPITEAVSLAELKRQTLIDDAETFHDSSLLLYGAAARRYYERRTGRTIHETEYEVVLPRWPAARRITLPRATPLIEVVSVTLTDSTEASSVWANYLVDTRAKIGAVALRYNESWPSFTYSPVSPIRVRYRAGIETASPLVEAHAEDKVPILMLAAALFENRETEVVKSNSGIETISVAYGIEAFIAQRKVDHVC